MLDFDVSFCYNSTMAKNQISTRISPEGLEIANAYLELGNVPAVCARLRIDEAKASEYLAKREVKAYVDQVYLDTGYRNRFKLAEVLDNLIEHKLEEAEESQVYTNKDLADIFTAYNNRASVAIIWTDMVTGDKSVSQTAYISSCEVSAPMEDVTTYSIEFTGTGAPTFATIA